MVIFNKTTEQPTQISTVVGQRARLTFSVEGLAAREELLFKGYVRLLDHLTEHEWQYHEASTRNRVDLLVANEHVQPTRCSLAGGQPQFVLLLGANNLNRSPFFLAWPLQPNQLENQLNRLGYLICEGAAPEGPTAMTVEHENTLPATLEASTEPAALEANTVPAPLVVVMAVAAVSAASPVGSVSAEPPHRHYRLRQWPKPMLLAVPGRMRLATLISGRAMSMDEIVFRSALPKQVCESFVADMQTAGLLLNADAPAHPALAWAPPPSVKPRLIAAEERQLPSPVPLAPQQGLIARIRMRFGI